MKIRLPRIPRHTMTRLRAWRGNRWVRRAKWAGVAVLVVAAFGGAAGQGQVPDPRQSGGPGGMVQIEDLHGKWDGVGTLPDGTPFCLVGWPCEDGNIGDK